MAEPEKGILIICTSSAVIPQEMKLGGGKMKKMTFLTLVFWLTAGAWVAGPDPIAAEEAYFKGKTIRIIAAIGPGGLLDFHARVTARHLPKYIPGKPSIIVQNMPGGRGNIAGNYTYNIAKPDGLTILMPLTGMPLQPVLGIEGIRYDPTKMFWLGSLSKSEYVLIIRSDRPYKTIQDVRKAKGPVYLGAQPGTGVFTITRLMMKVLKLPVEIIRYTSGTEIDLAIQRGEVDGRATTIPTFMTRNQDWMQSRFVNVFVQVTEERHPSFPDIPTLVELVPQHKALIDLATAQNTWMGSLTLPPRVPEAQARLLRQAFRKMIEDPQFKKELKVAANMAPTSGEQLEKKINKVAATPPKRRQVLRQLWGLK